MFKKYHLPLYFSYKPVDLYDTQNPENFWIVNENMFINQLRFVLKDVRRFVTISGEVVILDFSSFPIGNFITMKYINGLNIVNIIFKVSTNIPKDIQDYCI